MTKTILHSLLTVTIAKSMFHRCRLTFQSYHVETTFLGILFASEVLPCPGLVPKIYGGMWRETGAQLEIMSHVIVEL
jgi:hypothetical protein